LLLITQRPRIFLNSFIKSIILCSTSSKQIYSLWSRASGGEGHGKRHFHHPFLFVLFLFSFLPPFFLVHSDSFSYFVAWRTRERQSLNFTSCCLILFTLVTCNTIVACLPILNVLRAGTLHTLPSCLNLPAGRLTMPQTWPSLSTQPLEPSEHHSPHHAPTRNRESHCPGLPEDVIEATVEELAKSPCCWKGSPGPEGNIISHGVEVMARSLWGSCQGPITGVCVHTNIDPSENDFSVWGLCMTYSSENGNTVWGKMANRFSETQFREIHWPPFMSSLSVAICVVDKSSVLENKIKINAKELFSFSFSFFFFFFSIWKNFLLWRPLEIIIFLSSFPPASKHSCESNCKHKTNRPKYKQTTATMSLFSFDPYFDQLQAACRESLSDEWQILDDYNSQRQQLQSKLTTYGLRLVRNSPVRNNGDCLFDCLSWLSKGCADIDNSLRHELANYLIDHPEAYSGFDLSLLNEPTTVNQDRVEKVSFFLSLFFFSQRKRQEFMLIPHSWPNLVSLETSEASWLSHSFTPSVFVSSSPTCLISALDQRTRGWLLPCWTPRLARTMTSSSRLKR